MAALRAVVISALAVACCGCAHARTPRPCPLGLTGHNCTLVAEVGR